MHRFLCTYKLSMVHINTLILKHLIHYNFLIPADHAIFNKWLVLSDPNDSLAGSKVRKQLFYY